MKFSREIRGRLVAISRSVVSLLLFGLHFFSQFIANNFFRSKTFPGNVYWKILFKQFTKLQGWRYDLTFPPPPSHWKRLKDFSFYLNERYIKLKLYMFYFYMIINIIFFTPHHVFLKGAFLHRKGMKREKTSATCVGVRLALLEPWKRTSRASTRARLRTSKLPGNYVRCTAADLGRYVYRGVVYFENTRDETRWRKRGRAGGREGEGCWRPMRRVNDRKPAIWTWRLGTAPRTAVTYRQTARPHRQRPLHPPAGFCHCLSLLQHSRRLGVTSPLVINGRADESRRRKHVAISSK